MLLRLATLLGRSGDTARAAHALSVFRQVVDEFPLVIFLLLVVDLDSLALECAGYTGDAGADLRTRHRLIGPCYSARARGREDLIDQTQRLVLSGRLSGRGGRKAWL